MGDRVCESMCDGVCPSQMDESPTGGKDTGGGIDDDRAHAVESLERRLYRARGGVEGQTGGRLTAERPRCRAPGVGGFIAGRGQQLLLADDDGVGVGIALSGRGVRRVGPHHGAVPTGGGDDGEGGYGALHHHQRLLVAGVEEGDRPGSRAVVSGAGVGHIHLAYAGEGREGCSHADIVNVPCKAVGGNTPRRRLT